MKHYWIRCFVLALSLHAHFGFSDTQSSNDAWFEQLQLLTKTQPRQAYEQSLARYQQTQPDDWELQHKLVNIMAYQLLILSDLSASDQLLLEWLQRVPARFESKRTRALELLGVIAYRRGNTNKARDYLEQALDLAQKHNDKERIITVNINTAIFLQSLKLFEQAHELLLRAAEIAEQQQDISNHLLAVIRNNLSWSLVRLERYDEAIVHLQASLDIPEFEADDIAYARRLMADALISKKAFAKAKYYAEQALQQYQQRGDLYYQAELHLYLARIARHQQGFKLAEAHITDALALAEQAQAHRIKMDAHLELSEIKAAQLEPAAALAALQNHRLLFQSLHQQEAQRQLIMLREQLDYIEQQREIAALEDELTVSALNSQYNRRQSLLIILFLSVLSILLILFYRQQQKKRRQAEKLTQRLHQSYEQLQMTQKQLIDSGKMASLGKLVAGVAHELNTPLGILTTAASIMNESIAEMQRARSERTLTQQGFARLCSQLENSDELIRSNISRCSRIVQNIKQLAVAPDNGGAQTFTLDEAIMATRAKLNEELKNVAFNCVNTNVRVVCNIHYMQMLLQELCLNSVIHGFSEPDKGEITIMVEVTASGCQLLYSDNGRGLDEKEGEHIFEPFFTTKRGAGLTGLGLNLVYNLVVQAFSGSIEIIRTDKPGLSLKITFPKEILCSDKPHQ